MTARTTNAQVPPLARPVLRFQKCLTVIQQTPNRLLLRLMIESLNLPDPRAPLRLVPLHYLPKGYICPNRENKHRRHPATTAANHNNNKDDQPSPSVRLATLLSNPGTTASTCNQSSTGANMAVTPHDKLEDSKPQTAVTKTRARMPTPNILSLSCASCRHWKTINMIDCSLYFRHFISTVDCCLMFLPKPLPFQKNQPVHQRVMFLPCSLE